jgi:hypothetical protein
VEAPEDKNRNGYVCEDPVRGAEVRDDRQADDWFLPRGELFAGQRRGNVGPLPDDTTEPGLFGPNSPLAGFEERMKARAKRAMRDYVSCHGENVTSSRITPVAITPEEVGGRAAGGERVLSGPDTRLCQTQGLIARPDGELYVLNRSVLVGHDSAGAVGGWRTWVTVFDPRADGNATPRRSFDVGERRAGGATAFALDREGRIHIASAQRRERNSGSIDVFPAGANGNVAPIRTIYGQKRVKTPIAIALGPGDSLYVVNQEYAAIRVYSPRAKADSPAVRLIGGMKTGLVTPSGLAFDGKKQLVVADRAADIRMFEPGATGDVEPRRVISPHHPYGPIRDPRHVAVDGRGTLYVRGKKGAGMYAPDAIGASEPLTMMAGDSAPAFFAADWVGRLYVLRRDTVSVFEPRAWPRGRPVRVLAVPAGVSGMAVDRAGWVYLSNADSSFVAAYPPWARGNARPARTITGDRTRVSRPLGLAFDQRDNLYVLNGPQPDERAAVRVYAADATGEAEAVRVITGGRTGIGLVNDIAFDNRGDMYLAQGDTVAVFDAGAVGDQAPKRVLTAPQLRVRNAYRLAIGPGDTLYVLRGYHWGPFLLRMPPPQDVSVTVYAPLAAGDAEPVRTIEITRQDKSAGRGHGFLSPSDLAVDSGGAVYVSFCEPSPAVARYAPGASGAVAAERVWEASGSAGFGGPVGLTSSCWEGFRVVGGRGASE